MFAYYPSSDSTLVHLKRLLWTLSLAFFSTQLLATTIVSKGIAHDTTWSLAGTPYYLQGEIEVAPNAKLTILPGVVVQGSYGSGLHVEGELLAVDAMFDSTVKNNVIAIRNGGQGLILSSKIDWRIYYQQGSFGEIDGSIGQKVYFRSGSPFMIDSEFQEVHIEAPASVVNNTIVLRVVFYDSAGTPNITGNTFTGAYPIASWDPDDKIRGVSGNTYTYPSPIIWLGYQNVEKLDGDLTLYEIDGLKQYENHGDRTVSPTGALTISPGITLRVDGYSSGFIVDGRLSCFGGAISGDGLIGVRDGGVVQMSNCRIDNDKLTLHGGGQLLGNEFHRDLLIGDGNYLINGNNFMPSSKLTYTGNCG